MPLTLQPEHISLIKGLTPLRTSAFDYNPLTWAVLIEAHQLTIGPYDKNTISRYDIVKAYRDYYTLPKKEKLKHILILTMMWGFGKTGYGVYRTKKYLTDKNISSFESALLKLLENHDEFAFRDLMSINGLGISYVSKILYFASRALGRADYMLIFDIRVAHAMVYLTNPLLASMISVYPSSKWKDYKRYNDLIHQVAQKHDLEAESLEMFLFNQEFENF